MQTVSTAQSETYIRVFNSEGVDFEKILRAIIGNLLTTEHFGTVRTER
ncbi:hypothetical protein AGMMS49975_19250 [Clostridia bacterium]|nr:hypothetical protein AGMMS49975_19250 [Clostridia bacterium]